MKILFCINTMIKGGAERVISNLSNFFCENNDVYLLTLNNSEIMYELDKNIKLMHLDNDKLDLSNESKKSIFKRFFKQINRIIKYKKIVKENKIDVIVAFLPVPSYISLLIGKFTKTKVIISVRNDPKIEYSSKIHNILMKLLYKFANRIVFQTEDAMNYFTDDIIEKGIIIPNPINPNFLNSYYYGERIEQIISVGRLEEQKNQLLLIRAFSKLDKKYENYQLLIYGEGLLRRELEQEIIKLNLQNKVILKGISNNIKDDIIRSTLFVMTSNYEGMPNALMEAMALGLAVISTDCPCGGPRFLIKNNENGILIPVNDEESLIKSIECLLSNKEKIKLLGINAAKRMEELSPDIINKKWFNMIREVYNENN